MSGTTVVYLAGFGRSGSTLVERMLGAAPAWTNVGELVDLPRTVAPGDERCGCGEPFSACPFWTGVGDVAFGGWTPEVLGRLAALQRSAARQRHLPRLLTPRHPASEDLTCLRTAYSRIYQVVAQLAGARVVVDASKGPAFGQALARAPGVDLRVLNLVRDPRAVAWSWNRRVERPHAQSGGEEMWRIPARRAALQWGALQLEVETMASLGRTPSTRLLYEDFVIDPVGSLVAATAALGVPLRVCDLPPVVDGCVDLAPSHGLAGNPVRFSSGAIALRRDDDWQTEMPLRDRAAVTALTLPLLTLYGYPAVSRPAPRAGTSALLRTRSST